MNAHKVFQFAALVFTAIICCVIQPVLSQKTYQVGVPVCDTIETRVIAHSNAPGGCDYPEDYLDFNFGLISDLNSYVTGLNFELIVTETSGRVWTSMSDSVKAGDVFSLPTDLRIFFRVNSSFGFITRIVGTPTVAYESYYCEVRQVQTTSMCHNSYGYIGEGQVCQVLPATSVEERYEGSVPLRFQLLQNYPNPFNASTNIEFALPRTTEVSLKVFTLHVEVVAALLNQSKFAAGRHRISWNTKNLPSGIYLYRLHTNDGFVAVRKLVLLK